jgi:putative flavoprotein involved in K+ transport
LGHLEGARGSKVFLATDVKQRLAGADRFEAEILKMIDDAIEREGLEAAPDHVPQLRDGYEAEEIADLDLDSAGITTIIWGTGYKFDFSLIRATVFERNGFPVQRSGVTSQPGLYFAGLGWSDTRKTGLLLGVGKQAEHIAATIASAGR